MVVKLTIFGQFCNIIETKQSTEHNWFLNISTTDNVLLCDLATLVYEKSVWIESYKN